MTFFLALSFNLGFLFLGLAASSLAFFALVCSTWCACNTVAFDYRYRNCFVFYTVLLVYPYVCSLT